MDQMIAGQILSRLNTLEDYILILSRQVSALSTQAQEENPKLDAILQETQETKALVTAIDGKIDTLTGLCNSMDAKLNTIVSALPDLKCKFPGGNPNPTKNTKNK